MSESLGSIDKKYSKIIKISIYFSVWLLSFMILFTYHSKRQSTVEYNKLITKINTKKLMDQIKIYEQKCINYYRLAYPNDVVDEENEVQMSGLMEAKKEMYNEMLKTIEIYDKCNYIRVKSADSPLPYTEVSVSLVLLAIIVVIIIIANMRNNPFTTSNKTDKLKTIGDNITDLNMFKNVQTGGGDSGQSNYLNLLNTKSLKIKTQLSLMKGNLTVNYILVAFSILSITFYIVYNMFTSSLNYGNNLYSGLLFMKSRCYKT